MMIFNDPMPQVAQEHLISNDDITLAVKIYPLPEARTVILLHGGPGVPDEMTEVRDFLSEKLQVIVFDQRGTGESNFGKCSYTMEEYVEDINLITQFFNIRQFYLLGHSWGGVYAQLYAIKYPQRIAGLFLCSPGPGTGKAWIQAEREVFLYNWKRSTLIELFLMAIHSALAMMGSRRAYIRLFRQIIINYHKGYNVPLPDNEKLKRINARASDKTRKEIRKYAEIPNIGETSFPVVITYGEFDAYGNSKNYLINRFPHAKLIIVPKSGHTPWKHNWPVFRSILADFFSTSTTPPGWVNYVK